MLVWLVLVAVVPVPLVVARTALALVPQAPRRIPCPGVEPYLPAIRAVVAELDRAADGELVRVEERDRLVSVRKESEAIRIEVRDGSDDVAAPRSSCSRSAPGSSSAARAAVVASKARARGSASSTICRASLAV